MKRIIPIIIILAAVGGGYWWFNQPAATALNSAPEATALVGSGAIEAETVTITAELGGRVVALLVDEGDEVTVGQILVELDKSDLLAQQIQLEAALSQAKTNLDLVSAPARLEDIAIAQAQLNQANVAADGAQQSWNRAAELANNPHTLEAKITQAQAQVTEAEQNLELAQVNLKRTEIQAEAASRNQSNNAAMVQNDVARYQLQAAQTGVKMAQVALAGAQQQVEHWTGIYQRPVQLIAQTNAAEAAYRRAEAAILVAEANLTAVQADPTAEDIAVAQAQVHEAEAALAAVEVQLAKQTLVAPRAGLITKKLVDSGELAAPGAALLELSDIDTVELTLYIPETRIGQVQLGQNVLVDVDAYAEEQFEGVVSFIAHEAEFTPRTVQTQEERVNLVFAVKIKLDNVDHRLKPGMPADAEILTTGEQPSTQTVSPSATPQNAPKPSATPKLSQNFTPTPTASKATATPTPTVVSTPTREAEVVTWWLNVRSGPGVDYAVIGGLAQGDVVPIIGVDSGTGWLQVQLPDNEKSGWISGSSTFVEIR